MIYNIEISFDLIKNENSNELNDNLINFADKFNCDNIYTLSEMEGQQKNPRHHLIFVITFLKKEFKNFLEFIKLIKKFKKYKIDCIYEENKIINIIYASNYYQGTMDKNKRQEYKRKRGYSDEETLLLNEL